MRGVMSLSFQDRAAMFWRSLAVQGAWNYPRMQGLGFLFILVPWLRKVKKERFEKACLRHLGYFNTHPFLAGYVAGVVARMEEEGKEKESIRARESLMGPLGALGDGLFWARLRPAAIFMALVVSLFWPWAGALALLVFFNAVHFKERWSGIKAGYNRVEEPIGGISTRWRKMISSLCERVIPIACGFILAVTALRSGKPLLVLALFLAGFLLHGRRGGPVVLGSLLAVALLLGFLGVEVKLPWSM